MDPIDEVACRRPDATLDVPVALGDGPGPFPGTPPGDLARGPNMDRIDEVSRRRPGFREGIPIRLADGQSYHFPMPRLRLRPTIEAGKVGVRQDHSLGPEYLVKVEAYYAALADEAGGMDAIVAAYLDLAVALLLSNYDLSPEQVGELIYFDYGMPTDEENVATVQAITDVALARDPKKTTAPMSLPA